MSQFAKTLIVDLNQPEVEGSCYQSIDAAAGYFRTHGIGGTIIVETGTYTISSSVGVPSDTTIIGHGNVVVNVTGSVPAFQSIDSNCNNVLSGFNIKVDVLANTYEASVIDMRNVSNCRFERICITTTNPQNAVANGNNAIYLHNATNCTVSMCTVRGESVNPAFVNGIFLIYGSGQNIKFNHVSGCVANIHLLCSNHNHIRNNIFSRATGANILLERSQCVTISGNQLNESDITTGSHGIYPSGCDSVLMIGNIVCRNAKHGIKPRFDATFTPNTNFIIMGNVCGENGKRTNERYTGIFLQGLSEHMVIMGNVSYNNTECGNFVQYNDAQPPDTTIRPAVNNLVVGNVAVLHGDPQGPDLPISVYDTSVNSEADNLTKI